MSLCDLFRGLVENKLAACVNIIPSVKSVYVHTTAVECNLCNHAQLICYLMRVVRKARLCGINYRVGI